ncbi:MAG TPA: hypothetical protein VGI83_06930 [Gemmatimonadales bacterium]|jgi:hypothetical protein
MGLTMRPSHPAVRGIGLSLRADRDEIVAQWAGWVAAQMTAAPQIERPTVVRQLTLLVDIMIEMTGPLRRRLLELWVNACSTYGRAAAERGLAAGEVVEEMQHLREILIRHLSETVSTLPARQSMATVLRLNRVLDRGVTHAVVGYTDALVETLLNQRGVPVPVEAPLAESLAGRLEQSETELQRLRDLSL